jgi:hypothetical protein
LSIVMADDPTGTVGLTHELAASDLAVSAPDLALVTRGGLKFMQRLQQLGDAADRYQQALLQLGLGQSVQVACDEAQRKLAEAEQRHQRASAVLDEADAKAKAILDEANRQAADTASLRRDLEDQLRGARAKEQRATEATDAAHQAAARAGEARRKAEAKEKEFTDKIDRLKAELSKVL